MLRAQDRAESLGDAVGGYLVDRVEEARVVDAGGLGERLDASERAQRRAGLIEADVAGASDAEQLEVNTAGLDDVGLVAIPRTLQRQIGRASCRERVYGTV